MRLFTLALVYGAWLRRQKITTLGWGCNSQNAPLVWSVKPWVSSLEPQKIKERMGRGGIKRPPEQLGWYAALVASAPSSSYPPTSLCLPSSVSPFLPLSFPLSLPLPICLLLFLSLHSFHLCCVWCTWRLDKGTRSLRTGVTDDCKSTHGFWQSSQCFHPWAISPAALWGDFKES